MSEDTEDITYYPYLGEKLPNGNLKIPCAGISEDGERWCGNTEIGINHNKYNEWLEAIQNKDIHLEKLGIKTRKKRETVMDAGKIQLLKNLAEASTKGQWEYLEGKIISNSNVIAYICQPNTTPNFQQEIDAELIVELHNSLFDLLSFIDQNKSQRDAIQRLNHRIVSLEEIVYKDKE